MTIDGEHPIVLYDGVCGLCDKSVRFVLRRDRADCFRFAALQSPLAASILSKHGIDPARLESVRVVVDPGGPNERVLSKTRAILYILDRLGGIWRVFAPFRLFPDAFLNLPYAFIARVRYRVFGRHDLCALPKPEWRAKFLDAPET
ncbi:MAG: DCC1-like thiol-disulfide oxidoreductase family protein [Isosphaeraceae bacterium]